MPATKKKRKKTTTSTKSRRQGNKVWVEAPEVKGGGYWRKLPKGGRSNLVGGGGGGSLTKTAIAAGVIAAIAGAGIATAGAAINASIKKNQYVVALSKLDQELNNIQKTYVKLKANKSVVLAATAATVGTGALGLTLYHDIEEAKKIVKPIRKPNTPDGMPDEETYKYYDTLEPGDLIWRSFPTAMHYAVYMGKDENGQHYIFDSKAVKEKDGQRSVKMNLTKIEQFSKPENSQYEKVPDEEIYNSPNAQKYTKKEVVDRVKQVINGSFEWDLMNSNCESLARAITTGEARSTQSENISGFTKGTISLLVKASNNIASLNKLSSRGVNLIDLTGISEGKEDKSSFWSIEAQRNRKTAKQIAKQLHEYTENQRGLAEMAKIKTDSLFAQNKQVNPFDNELYFDENGLRESDVVLDSITAISKYMKGNLQTEIQVKLVKNYLLLLFGILSEGKTIPQ